MSLTERLTHVCRNRRQRGDRRMPHARHRRIDLLERPLRLLAREPMDGLGHDEVRDRDEHCRHRSAEVEDGAPVVALQELRGHDATGNRAERIADRHQRHAQVPPLGAGELRGHGVDGREHAANAETCDDPPDRQIDEAGHRRRHDHAERHHRKASEDRRATTDLVGDATEHDRADGHANQFHRQNDAEPGAVDAPFSGDAGRRKADRENVETVERVQSDRDADHENLQPAHGGLGDDVSRVAVHTAEGITFSVAIEQHG